MANVILGAGLSLPAEELATQVVAALGMRGSGKSNVMAVIAEGLLAADVQVIILDYVGIWFSLRLDETGRHPSPYQIPVLGGPHGDIAVQPHAGAMVAEALAQSGSSAVLDVSTFSKGARCAFATDLGEALFAAKKRHPGPTFLVLEEAQRFIPQKLFKGQERMLGAFEEIAEVGRNYGLGLGMISQRPQKIAKDVLNLTELLFAFQTNGVLERKAIAEWVQEKDAGGRSEVNNELPSLRRGEALVWSPSWLRVYGKHDLRKKTTYDAGATPLRARAAVSVKPLDLAALASAMTEVVEQAKQNDPNALRAEVLRLQRELAAARRSAPAAPPVEVRVPFVPRHVIGDIEGAQRRVVEIGDALSDLNARLESAINGSELRPAPEAAAAAPRERPRAAPRAATNGDAGVRAGGIGGGALEVLSTLAAAGGRLTKRQLATLCGIRPSVSTLRNYLSLLKREELVSVDGNDVVITRVGAGRVGDPPALKTAAELLAMWRANLPQKPGEILSVFAAEHGPFTGEVIRKRCNVPPGGSTLRNYLSILRSNGLIHKARGGLVVNPLLAH